MDGLLAEKPIVTVKFFENWIKALEKNPESPLPDIAHHIPPLDSTLATQFDQKLFLPNTQRKTIFQGKTFIFSQPNPIYAAAVEKAGGNVKMDLNFDDVNQDVLLVEWSSQLPGNQQTSGKRVIPFKDISYAILECSTGRFYNSSYTSMGYAANKSSSSSQNFSQSHDVTISREESCFDKSEPPLKKKKVEHSQGAINLQPPNKKVCVESIRIEVRNISLNILFLKILCVFFF